jgi:hypothetical protein
MNNYRSPVIILLMSSLFLACKVTNTKIIGNYIDRQNGDTLRLSADKTFEYQEKLSYGEFGWNTGLWLIRENAVSFYKVKPNPVVGYRLKKDVKENIEEALKVTLVLNASDKLIAIKNVAVSLANTSLDTTNFKVNSNSVTINTSSFDTVSLATFYFPPFIFNKNEFEKNKHYQITIYQAERLFELDKFSFYYKRRSLFTNVGKMKFRKI